MRQRGWCEADLLDEVYAVLLFRQLPPVLAASVRRSLAVVRFDNPWSGSGFVELEGDVVEVALGEMPSVQDAFAAVAGRLGMADDGTELNEATWLSWC